MDPGHLIVLPIVLPLLVGAALLLLDERQVNLKAFLNVVSTASLLGIAILLMRHVDTDADTTQFVYRLGNWPLPFAITLVVDRLAAMMLTLTAVLALASLLFALARWHRAGPHFHTLFQFLLVGLNGAFLTGDLFNLFVFFEVLLASSYGLVLHGSGRVRVQAGLHYIAVNLAGSMLLLIGISLIYGVTGTLNMADLAARLPALAPSDRALAEAGAAVLAIAFFVKAGLWPLGFWLPTTYTAAAAPVAALFAIMSKVGVYAVLRLWLLVFGVDAGASAQFGAPLLLAAGMATVMFGMIGVLASQDMSRLAGYSVLVSSGTLLAVIGTGNGSAIGAALFYLVSSTLAIAALFLLIELIERGRDPAADVFAVTMEAYGEEEEQEPEKVEVGVAIPATIAMLGVAFIGCAVLLAGLPPLSGFVAKFAILTSLINPAGLGADGAVPTSSWVLVVLLIVSGLAALIAMTRAGIRTLWAPLDPQVPLVQVTEVAPIGVLLALCLAMTVLGAPVMRYMDSTARVLQMPQVIAPPPAQTAQSPVTAKPGATP